jgi:hypothetical protein
MVGGTTAAVAQSSSSQTPSSTGSTGGSQAGNDYAGEQSPTAAWRVEWNHVLPLADGDVLLEPDIRVGRHELTVGYRFAGPVQVSTARTAKN